MKGKGGGGWLTVLTYVLPFVIFLFFWLFIINQMQGGGSKVMSFGKSRAKRMSVDSPKITFRDVAGVDEAVEELHEIKEFLENPKKFQALGARIPKGVLLYGPPGTGKTLLARAVAGEAGVPFFSISGSDFVEMFVGVGASRVRDLFEQAKQNSPCIIFMDEIDAVGRHRGAGLGGGHDEREQTLNQLLVEMDGFEMKDNIILIAATNRPDILDPALLRPGRFDRQIVVDRPDRKGRAKILEVHTRGKPLAKEIDLDNLAAQTPGLHRRRPLEPRERGGAARRPHGQARDRPPPPRRGDHARDRGPGEEDPRDEREGAPHHGVPRDGPRASSRTTSRTPTRSTRSRSSRAARRSATRSRCPTEDKFLTTRAELNDTMAMTLGGRAAEEIVFGEVTTGASNDLEKVTATAKQMVMRFGMSEKLGPRVFGHDHGQPFLGREFSSEPDYSDDVAREIDAEIRRIVEEAHQAGARHPRAAPRGARHDVRDPAQARDDRARGVPRSCSTASPRKRSSAPTSRCGRSSRRRRRSPRRSAPERAPAPAAAAGLRRRRGGDALGRPSGRSPAATPRLRYSARMEPGVVWASSTSRPTRSRTAASSSIPMPRSRTARELAARGRDILDIGGESTRPGAEPVAVDEELGGCCR